MLISTEVEKNEFIVLFSIFLILIQRQNEEEPSNHQKTSIRRSKGNGGRLLRTFFKKLRRGRAGQTRQKPAFNFALVSWPKQKQRIFRDVFQNLPAYWSESVSKQIKILAKGKLFYILIILKILKKTLKSNTKRPLHENFDSENDKYENRCTKKYKKIHKIIFKETCCISKLSHLSDNKESYLVILNAISTNRSESTLRLLNRRPKLVKVFSKIFHRTLEVNSNDRRKNVGENVKTSDVIKRVDLVKLSDRKQNQILNESSLQPTGPCTLSRGRCSRRLLPEDDGRANTEQIQCGREQQHIKDEAGPGTGEQQRHHLDRQIKELLEKEEKPADFLCCKSYKFFEGHVQSTAFALWSVIVKPLVSTAVVSSYFLCDITAMYITNKHKTSTGQLTWIETLIFRRTWTYCLTRINNLACQSSVEHALYREEGSGRMSYFTVPVNDLYSSSKSSLAFRTVKYNSYSCLGLSWPPETVQKNLKTHFSVNSLLLRLKFRIILSQKAADNIYMTNLCFLLLRSGDIEKNPGPKNIQLVTQNCRGLNSHHKLKVLMNNCNKLVQKSPLTIIALQETHLTNANKIKYHWRGTYFATNAVESNSAGCLTLFNFGTKIIHSIHIEDRAHICLVEGAINGEEVIVANIYAPVRDQSDKQKIFFRRFFQELANIKTIAGDAMIIMLGDFNISLNQEYRGNAKYTKKQEELVKYLRNMLKSYQLKEFHKGDYYSYQNQGNNAQSQIDYIFGQNIDGKYKCSTDWTFVKSDHAAILIEIEKKVDQCCNINKATRLKPEWLNNEKLCSEVDEILLENLKLIPEHWSAGQRLEFMKVCLRTAVVDKVKILRQEWNREMENIKRDLDKLLKINKNLLPLSMLPKINKDIEESLAKRDAFLEKKGKFLADKSRLRWFNEGERGTKFFLKMIESRQTNVEMKTLKINGSVESDINKIEEEICAFYTKLYNSNYKCNDEDDIFEDIPICSEDEKDLITRKITKLELEETLKKVSDSAPGPDGIPYSYYRAFWDVFGNLLADSYNASIEVGCFIESQRSSYLRLIPKEGGDRNELKNWRPITLSNCDYKLYTKALAERFAKTILTRLHPNQTAYIKGRQIQDNVRIAKLAAELCSGLLVMLDVQKAFDSISHNYIKKVLRKYGLAEFIPVFEALYKDQMVDIMVNERIIKGYKIGNGVKQGDCLSCVLFILAMDPLIRKIEKNDNISRLEINGIMMPKVLAYADDVMCFANGQSDIDEIFEVYQKFTKASGLKLNPVKTELLRLGNYQSSNNKIIVNYMGASLSIEVCDISKVNGVWISTQSERSQMENFKEIFHKTRLQLNHWSTKGLTLMGRIQIYKTFGMSQLLYHGGVIIFSDKELKLFDDLFNAFIWKKPLGSHNPRGRIKKLYFQQPIEKGGFGMIDYKEVLRSIRIRQLFKMEDERYNHPLKHLLVEGAGGFFQTGNKLSTGADPIAKIAQRDLKTRCLAKIKLMDGETLMETFEYKLLLSRILLRDVTKPALIGGDIANLLTHICNIETLGDIINKPWTYTSKVKKLIKKPWLKKILMFWENNVKINTDITENAEVYEYKPLKFKKIHLISSKTIRITYSEKIEVKHSELVGELDPFKINDFLYKVKGLKSVKHKNLAMRAWHGDVFGNHRLYQMGLHPDGICSHCNEIDTRLHLVNDCKRAKDLWTMLDHYFEDEGPTQNWLGINDSKEKLEMRLECLNHLVHFRDLTAIEIMTKSKNFIETIKRLNNQGFGDIKVDRIMD